MIDRLGQSKYFQWSKIKSQPIPITTIKSKWSFLVKSAFPDSVQMVKSCSCMLIFRWFL